MVSYQLLDHRDFIVQPWKNGQGSTTQLMCQKSAAEAGFDWRLSMADVVENGGFSDFSGYQRTLVLLEGNGISLSHNAGRPDILECPFDFCHFDGGWQTSAKLLKGPIKDFNVICKLGRCSAQVCVIKHYIEKQIGADADHTLIYSLLRPGTVHVDNRSHCIPLPAGQLLHIERGADDRYYLEGSWLICVRIYYQ